MDDLMERIQRELHRITPSPTAFDDAMHRVRRRERDRKMRAGAVGLALTAVLIVGLWLVIDRDDGRRSMPASPSSADAPEADRLFLSGDGEAWVVDPVAGTERHLEFPELAPGDPPHRVVRRGDELVAWGYRTLVVDPRNDWAARVLVADSLIFIPSAASDRVWVSIIDEDAPDARLQAVREVSVDGEVTVPDTMLPHGDWPIAAVNQGLVFQEGSELLVWDPRTGATVDRLPGRFPLAWQGDRLAWCDGDCADVHVTDFRTGVDVVVTQPPGTAGFEAFQGAFSPDGTSLAVAVRLASGASADRQLALVDVATAAMRPVDNGTVDTGYVFIDWAPSGRSVYITGGQDTEHRRVVEYRIGEPAARVVPVEVGDFFGMAVVAVPP